MATAVNETTYTGDIAATGNIYKAVTDVVLTVTGDVYKEVKVQTGPSSYTYQWVLDYHKTGGTVTFTAGTIFQTDSVSSSGGGYHQNSGYYYYYYKTLNLSTGVWSSTSSIGVSSIYSSGGVDKTGTVATVDIIPWNMTSYSSFWELTPDTKQLGQSNIVTLVGADVALNKKITVSGTNAYSAAVFPTITTITATPVITKSDATMYNRVHSYINGSTRIYPTTDGYVYSDTSGGTLRNSFSIVNLYLNNIFYPHPITKNTSGSIANCFEIIRNGSHVNSTTPFSVFMMGTKTGGTTSTNRVTVYYKTSRTAAEQTYTIPYSGQYAYDGDALYQDSSGIWQVRTDVTSGTGEDPESRVIYKELGQNLYSLKIVPGTVADLYVVELRINNLA